MSQFSPESSSYLCLSSLKMNERVPDIIQQCSICCTQHFNLSLVGWGQRGLLEPRGPLWLQVWLYLLNKLLCSVKNRIGITPMLLAILLWLQILTCKTFTAPFLGLYCTYWDQNDTIQVLAQFILYFSFLLTELSNTYIECGRTFCNALL